MGVIRKEEILNPYFRDLTFLEYKKWLSTSRDHDSDKMCREQHAKLGQEGYQQRCNRKQKTSCQPHHSQNLAYWVMKSSSPVVLGKKEKKSNIKTDMQIGIDPKAPDVTMIRPKVTEILVHSYPFLNSWLRYYVLSESSSFSSENNSFLYSFLLLLSLSKLYFCL